MEEIGECTARYTSSPRHQLKLVLQTQTTPPRSHRTIRHNYAYKIVPIRILETRHCLLHTGDDCFDELIGIQRMS